jgi:hypothetical protein
MIKVVVVVSKVEEERSLAEMDDEMNDAKVPRSLHNTTLVVILQQI